MRYKLSIALLALCATACAPRLGDGCKTTTECSVQGTRICDRAQPGGYCTIANCKRGDCGDEGVCVRWRPSEPRLSTSYCMAKCGNTGDCDRDQYVCRSAAQINEENLENGGQGELAEVLDGAGGAKFCTVKQED
jgi:hypothetical protein